MPDLNESLNELTARAHVAIEASDDLAGLDLVRVDFLGKKGELTLQLKSLGKLSADERPAAGQAINQVNVGNVHAIAHQFGGEYGIPHGLANAMVLPHVLDMSLESCRERLAELAVVIGKNSAEEFVAAVRELNATVDIPELVAELREADIPAIMQRAVDEGAGYSVPHFMEPAECTSILNKLLPDAGA
jgi:hypothetical protein